MPQIEISEELNAKLSAFRKVIEIITEIKPEDQVNYAEVVMRVGIERMLRDIFPAENKLLQDSMVVMFDKNPKFVAEYIVDTLEAGIPRNEVRDRWNVNQYIQ